VDGNWTVNSHLPQETDEHNNVNNVLHPHQLGEPSVLSSAAPLATTAALASAVPKESEKSVVPGAFPETPATEPAAFSVNPIPATAGAGNPIHLQPGEKVPDPSTLTKNTISSTIDTDEPAAFSVNPIPATEGAGNPIHLEPGEKVPDPSTLTSNTIQSTVSSDEPAAFSVNPIPATEGAGNPIHLEPGEKVPDSSTLTSNTIQSTVSSDEPEAFGIAPIPATAGIGNPIHLAPGEKVPEPSSLTANTLTSNIHTDKESYEKGDAPPGVAAAAPKDISGGAFDLPPISKNMIPESSLPMGGAAMGETDPVVTIQSAAPTSSTAFLAGQVPLEPTANSSGVPKIVTKSQEAARVSPEASANPEAVEEKKELEEELKVKVPEEPPSSEGGLPTSQIYGAFAGGVTTIGAATAGVAAIAHKHVAEASKTLDSTSVSKTLESSGVVPDVVKESIAKANVNPEATTSVEAVEEKDAVEAELLKKIKPSEESGEPAPTVTAETSSKTPEAPAASGGLSINALSNDQPFKSSSELEGLGAPVSTPTISTVTQENIKPETVSPTDPVKNGGLAVTSGLSTVPAAAETTDAGPATPKKETTETASRPSTTVDNPTASDIATPDSKTEKKKKRRSIFNKLKKIFD
jgi:hypothetical protein